MVLMLSFGFWANRILLQRISLGYRVLTNGSIIRSNVTMDHTYNYGVANILYAQGLSFVSKEDSDLYDRLINLGLSPGIELNYQPAMVVICGDTETLERFKQVGVK